jgi:hypothetical protein
LWGQQIRSAINNQKKKKKKKSGQIRSLLFQGRRKSRQRWPDPIGIAREKSKKKNKRSLVRAGRQTLSVPWRVLDRCPAPAR